MPVVDFEESMRSILNEKAVMAHIMKGLDPVTWRPNVTQQAHEGDLQAEIDDKDSGYLYRQGIGLHCPQERMIVTQCWYAHFLSCSILTKVIPIFLEIWL